MSDMRTSQPSGLLRILRWAICNGLMKRGYGRLLKHFPATLWEGKNVIVKTGVGNMVVPVSDPASTGLMLCGEITHEIAETMLIRCLTATCQTVIAIGAHFGWYSRLMAEAMEGKGRIYAFEPNTNTFLYLRENTRCRPEISVYPLALSD
jgi:hypothetical protein